LAVSATSTEDPVTLLKDVCDVKVSENVSQASIVAVRGVYWSGEFPYARFTCLSYSLRQSNSQKFS